MSLAALGFFEGYLSIGRAYCPTFWRINRY